MKPTPFDLVIKVHERHSTVYIRRSIINEQLLAFGDTVVCDSLYAYLNVSPESNIIRNGHHLPYTSFIPMARLTEYTNVSCKLNEIRLTRLDAGTLHVTHFDFDILRIH